MLTCPKCGFTGKQALTWGPASGGNWQLGATCAKCGQHIKWVPLGSPDAADAPPKPTAPSVPGKRPHNDNKQPTLFDMPLAEERKPAYAGPCLCDPDDI